MLLPLPLCGLLGALFSALGAPSLVVHERQVGRTLTLSVGGMAQHASPSEWPSAARTVEVGLLSFLLWHTRAAAVKQSVEPHGRCGR